MGDILIKKGLLLLFSILLFSACNDNSYEQMEFTYEPDELREKLIKITQLFGENEIEKSDVDGAINAADSLGLQGDDKIWFIRTYFTQISAGKGIESKEQVYEDSQLRMLYEQTWKDLAFERYGVRLDEGKLHEIIEMNINQIKELSPEQGEDIEIFYYFLNALEYSIDDYFYKIERYIYESGIIGQELFPLLEEEYGLKDIQEIGNKYRMEVIDEIVKNQS